MHNGLHNPLLAWLLYVISLYSKLTKVFVVYVQGVKEVNWFYPIPRSHLFFFTGRFCWEDLSPASSFLLFNSVQSIWVPFLFSYWLIMLRISFAIISPQFHWKLPRPLLWFCESFFMVESIYGTFNSYNDQEVEDWFQRIFSILSLFVKLATSWKGSSFFLSIRFHLHI